MNQIKHERNEAMAKGIEKTVAWTTGSGKKAAVEITLELSETIDLDGDRSEMGYTIDREPVMLGGTTYPAHIGRLLIPAAQLAEIDAVLTEIYARPEWQAKVAAEKRARKADIKVAEHMEKMRQVMGY